MTRRFEFGGGRVVLGTDASPVSFQHTSDPDRLYLLDEVTDTWHGPDHSWGTGFAITSRGSGRWQTPREIEWRADGATARHRPVSGLELEVQRQVAGDRYTETYTWTNTGDEPLQITGLGVNVPVRDVYDGAAGALARSCHAHVFTGGAWSWVLAEPMAGTPPLLGAIVRTGALWAYSVESRNSVTWSDIRGHLVVHPTDHARSPEAFGGQPVLDLAPGEEYVLAWELGWYGDREAFLAATDAPAELPSLTAPVGTALEMRLAEGTVLASGPGDALTSSRHGVQHIDVERDGRRSRTAVAFLAPVRELVEARVARILREHRPHERPEPERYAFVPVDTRTGLAQTENGWQDWTDGAERIGMAVLLQQARLRGWGGSDGVDAIDAIDAALQGFARFARERLVDPDGAVRRGSRPSPETLRLYNTPWLAHFFHDQFALYDDPADLDLAARLLEASYSLGVRDHLLIGQPEAMAAVTATLDEQGHTARAKRLREALVDHAHGFADRGTALPRHEVSYEQSMVAPLVTLLATAYDTAPDDRLLTALGTAVRWLHVFGGPQPHVRLRDIAIRHWDGYWFGIERLWGDTFPHYWSVLTAIALRQLPESLRDEDTERVADAIFAANLVDFDPDGLATCAFVMPSCVDGRPAHRPDPLMNDQDWALALLLRSAERR
ncbi:hypothetical protein [Streptomyces sp. SP18BB07]|uniref:hypothetical protein n=1 Tax=Streptomyces sp. SP18BB07 TaxID=3002522 RepID=UPI002E75FE58|nr:hypothetical protein [Streptomyces sp. SP18BB07]MEE1765113.1 hypothetical protein [Streptomyces sp. SP18BB07]